jgi:hypothetical protein
MGVQSWRMTVAVAVCLVEGQQRLRIPTCLYREIPSCSILEEGRLRRLQLGARQQARISRR